MNGITSIGKFVGGIGRQALVLVASQYTEKGLMTGVDWAIQKVAHTAKNSTENKSTNPEVTDTEEDNVPSFAKKE